MKTGKGRRSKHLSLSEKETRKTKSKMIKGIKLQIVSKTKVDRRRWE
jgi:hypothetical protein